ncbi:MAG: YitT family protein [Treponema sp.]
MEREIRTIVQKEMHGFWGELKRVLLICAGAVVMSLNIKCFVNPVGLLPGGFTGVTLLLQEIFEKYLSIKVPFTLINLLFNSVPVVISFIFIGKKFTLYSLLMIVLSSILTDVLPSYVFTKDILLSSVFGGGINAVAIFLCLEAGATSGGTDFISIFISEKYGKDAWNYILVFNMAVLTVSGALFGWNSALYSIIFQFVSTQLLKRLYRRYQKTTLFVVTDKPDEVYKAIKDTTNHDATLFKGTGCYKKTEKDMLYSVVSADEVNLLSKEIHKVDSNAFTNVVKSQEILGKFYRKPND